jgi:flagellar basal body-associated protein FliL
MKNKKAQVQLETNPNPEPKKSKKWLGIIIILIVLVLGGAIAYFLLSGDNSPISLANGGSIPQPPALPD